MIPSASSLRFPLRTLAAASAMAVAPAALAATVTILDNADLNHSPLVTYVFKTDAGVTTLESAEADTAGYRAAQPYDPNKTDLEATLAASLLTTSHANSAGFIDPAWITNIGTVGFSPTSFSTSVDATTGVTTETLKYVSLNAPYSLIGGTYAISAGENRDVSATPGAVGESLFTAYSALSQATGRFDLFDKTGGTPDRNRYYNGTGYDSFGTYSATNPVVGYFIDATDYSGLGNLVWTGASRVAVIAGNNTYTGDTYVNGTMIVMSNLGQGTLHIAGGELVFNQPGSAITLANAISGGGALTFQGDTTLDYSGFGARPQTTTVTYDSVNFSGAVRIESGIAGLNMLVLGDGSTSGATANTGTLGKGDIHVGRLDGNLDDGAYAETSLAQTTTAKLKINLSGTKTLANSSITLHARTELENAGGAASDITIGGTVSTGDLDSVRIVNTSGKLTFAKSVTLGAGGYTAIDNNSTGDLTFTGPLSTGGRLDIANNSTGDLYLDGVVSGQVFIYQRGASTTRLTGINTFDGIITVNNPDGVIEFTNSKALGTGTIQLAGGTLKLGGTTASTISNAVNLSASSNLQTDADLTFTGAFTSSPATAPVLTKIGAAKLILTGNNDTFAGTFVVADNGGTLQAGNGGTTGTFGTKAIQVGADATVAVNRSDAEGVTVGNLISGAGNFEQLGTGLTLMTGANTYTGTTHVAAGTLQVGDGVTSGNLGTGAVTVDAGATLAFKRSDDVVVANAIGGAGNLLQNGTGATFLTGANTYTGTTTITDGALVIGNAGTTGSIGSGAVVNDATLGFYRTDDFTVANAISGPGTLRKALSNTVTLSGPVSGQSVWVEDGTLNVTNASTLGNVRIDSGAANLTGTVSGFVEVLPGATLTVGAGATDLTSSLTGPGFMDGTLILNSAASYSLNIDCFPMGVVEQRGAGVVTLAPGHIFDGKLVLTKGTVAFSDPMSLGFFFGMSVVKFNGGTLDYTGAGSAAIDHIFEAEGNTLSFINSAADLTLLGGITRTGTGIASIRKTGGGNLDYSSLSIGADVNFIVNTFDLHGVSTTTADFNDSLDVTNTGALADFIVNQNVDGTASGVINGNLNLVKNGVGTLTLTGTNSYQATVINGGVLQIGDGGTTGTLGLGPVTNDATLTFNRSDDIAVTNDISGTGALNHIGGGVLVLSGTNSYSGATAVSNGGTLRLGSASAFNGAGALDIAAGATFDAAGNSFTTAALTGAGTVTLGSASVTVQSGDFSGAISGAGGLTKSGTGTLTLSGTNTYTGATSVAGGTLTLGAASSFNGAGTLDIAANATFDAAGNNFTTAALSGSGELKLGAATATVNQASDTTFVGAISGAGSLTKAGAGTLTLSGANTYIGGTTISAGTLALGASDVIADAGAVVVEGGTLALGGNSETVGAVSLKSGAITGTGSLAASSYAVESGSISANLAGSGTLTKTTGGTVILTGSNTYGATAITAGTLEVGTTGSLGTGAVTVDATLRFAGTRTVANTLTGAGTVAQSDSGTLTLSDVSGFSGTVSAHAGRVVLAESALHTGSATVAAGATLEFSGVTSSTTTAPFVFTLPVSGAGNVEFSGPGVTSLGTDPTLTVLANTGNVTVRSGHTLVGQGRIGGSLVVASGATLAPGNSPGIIVAPGNLTLAGLLHMEVAGGGAPGTPGGYDQLQVGGTATLGGALNVTYTGAAPLTGTQSFRLITASAVSGAFTTVTLPTSSIGQITTDASGVLYTSYDAFGSIPGITTPAGLESFDRALVASGTGAGTAAGAILNVLNTSGGAAASQALVNSSPVGLGALNALAVDEARGTTELMRTRLDSRRRALFESGYQPLATYANVTGANANVDSDAATFDRDYFGGKGGLERVGNDGMTLGANVGYDKGRASFHNGGGKVTQDHLSASGYVSHQFDRRSFMYLGAFGGLSSYDSERNTVLGKASGDTNGWDLGATALLGYEIRANEDLSVTPYAGVTYMRSHFSAFNEKGAGALNLDMEEGEYDSLRTKVGADIDWKLPTGDIDLRLGLGIAWEHELLDDEATLTGAFANGAGGTFETESAMLSRDTLSVGPQATFAYGDGNQIRLGYRYQYGFGDETGHRFDLTFSTRF